MILDCLTEQLLREGHGNIRYSIFYFGLRGESLYLVDDKLET